MQSSKLKNIVILNNLPSNLVEEAIIVLKENKNIKNFQKIEQANSEINSNYIKKNSDYIIKEAEMLINKYALKCEKKKEIKLTNRGFKKLKIYATLITVVAICEGLIILLK